MRRGGVTQDGLLHETDDGRQRLVEDEAGRARDVIERVGLLGRVVELLVGDCSGEMWSPSSAPAPQAPGRTKQRAALTVGRLGHGRLLILDAERPAEEKRDAPVEDVDLRPEPPSDLGLLDREAPALAVDVQALCLAEAHAEADREPSLRREDRPARQGWPQPEKLRAQRAVEAGRTSGARRVMTSSQVTRQPARTMSRLSCSRKGTRSISCDPSREENRARAGRTP